jgi:hypothetical protein
LLGFRSGSIQIRRLFGVDSIQRSYVHRKEVRDITLSPDGNLAVSVDDSGQVAMWNAETGEIFGVLFEPPVITHGDILMAPALEFLDTGELLLIYDDGGIAPRIVRWQSVATHDRVEKGEYKNGSTTNEVHGRGTAFNPRMDANTRE